MTVTGKLGEDALIGIYKDKNGVFTDGLEGNGSIANFVADDGDMYFIRETDGEAEFVKKAVLTYHGNGFNSGAVPSQETYMPNSEVTVSGNTGELVKKGRIFDGWNTKADGSGETYREGDTFEIVQDTTLYAMWIHNDTHDDADFVKWTATDSLPTVAGDYYLTACVTITSTWNVPAGVTKICLNGFGIKLSGNGSVMSVGEGATLYIYDCYTSTNYYYTYPQNYYGLATDVGGTSWASGKTSFSGGYITGGNGTLDGGERKGGALYIANGGQAFIHGGKFIGNSANYGGVFYVRSGSSLTIADSADISYNATVGNATWHSGGAVFIENDATVYMTGGRIYNNYACGNRGGGVQVENGSFYLSGGSITGNRTNGSQGAGVCVWQGAMYVSGNPQVLNNRNTQNTSVQNNVYIHETPARLCVVGELTGTDGYIGITLNDYSGSFTNTAEENIEYNRASAFSSDNSSYILIQNDNGQLSFIDGNTVALVKNGDVKSYFTDFSAALNAWGDGGTLTLLKEVSISSTIVVENATKTLDLNGHGIKMTSTGSVIRVGEGATLNLYDGNATTEHRYSVSGSAANGAGVATVNDALTSNYQTFNGGYITGGYFPDGYKYGAGVNLEGNGATLYMYGGTIIGNRLTAGTTGGGGVCVQDWDKSGGFYMYGGSIVGNTSNYGGGVYVRCGKMELIGGNISKNVANGNIGGGVLVFGGNSTLVVQGGAINNNTAVYGGAVEASGDGTVIISGGSFTNNLATGQGGALTNQRTDGNTSPASFYISGSPVFSDNTAGGQANDFYLCNTAVLNLTAALSNTAKIVIKKASTTGAFTSGWSTYMEDADPFDYFISDNANYEVRLSGDEAYIGTHVHVWSYTVNGNVITATCAGIEKGTCPLTAQTLTLNAAGKPYDGQSVTATVVKSAGWTTENGLPAVADIVYSGNTNAGTYTASITVAEKTATVEFTITPIDVTVTITGHNDTVDYDRNEHTVSGYDVVFGSDLYTSEDFTFSGTDTVTLTNVGTGYMGLAASQFENTNDNFNTVTFNVTDGYITVEPIDVTITITGHNDTVDYDRNEHTVSGYDVEFSTDVYIAEDYIFSGTDTVTLTNVGTTYMGLSEEVFENINTNFATVTFEITDGYITVEPIDVTITITGHNDTVDYDRNEHTVSGYDVEFSTDVYIAEDYIFSGTDTVTLTNVGTTYMGLSEEVFENINTNFATVTFEITDGYITVEPIDVTITITGHNDTVDYDGKEHTVSGYDVEFSTDVYIAEDYIFSGTDTVTLTNVGTVYMELSEEQFENINTNFATVTFEITDGYITVEPIDVTVTITGHNDTVDYDGMWHSVSGYDAVPGNDLYDVLNDFTFSGEASVRQANAGTSYMGLSEEQFENINTNFATVTFEITDGYITVEPIDVTITITGHNDTVDYDGTAHRVVGYEAISDNGLYNVNKDIVLSGIASAIQTEVGTGYMGLDASRFTNRNDNFATVTFEITDGYITVEPIDVTFIVVPYAQELVYDGTEQQLIVAGEAVGGTLYYALSLDDAVAPADNNYGTAIPSAKEVGKYYVWYKVIGDNNHNDLLPVCVKAVVAEEEWPSLYGVVYNNDGTPSVGAIVTLISGNQTIDHVTTDADGNYRFSVLAGVYNIVAEYEDITETVFVTVFEETELDIVMPDGKTESILNVNTEGGEELGVAVGGLNGEAQAVRKENPSADNVAVIMTVEKTTEDGAANADPIVKSAEDKTLSFFEIKVEKTVDSVTTAMDETDNVMEIAIPYEKTGKRGITVYSYHDSKVRTFVESDSKADGTFRVDKANKIIYVYANKFSTYAIGYTPYYRVQTSLSLGSYTGKASVTLQNNADAKIKFTLNDTDVNKLVFPDVPKGQYTMTVTWGEGNTNTLKMALTVGAKVVLLPITEQETQNEETDAQIFAATDTADEAEIISESGNAETGVVAGIGYEAVVFGQAPEIATAQKINREIVMIPRRRD